MNLTVDRIDGDFAVCENDDCGTINVPLAMLPEGVREGDIVEYTGGAAKVATNETEKRRAEIEALQNEIFSDG